MERGDVVECTVLGHEPWGLVVRTLPPAEEDEGTVDIALVSDRRPFDPAVDYPAVGTVIRAVVIAHNPPKELRLNAKESALHNAAQQIGQQEGHGSERGGQG